MALGGGLGLIVVIIVASVAGIDPGQIMGLLGGGGSSSNQTTELSAAEQEAGEFVKTVLADTETVWHDVFRKQLGKGYLEPKLVLYSGQTRMHDGHLADARTGPFYYPKLQTVYIDTSFFAQMKSQMRAGGDFAYAYVVAHEVGHHVQRLLGYTDRVHSQRGRIPEAQYNRLSVRLELQADFLAGLWAHHAERRWRILEEGDIEEAMNAANAIGDDRLQKQAQGYVVEDSFTHGTSEQRMRWFMKGLRSGQLGDGDTFSLPYDQL